MGLCHLFRKSGMTRILIFWILPNIGLSQTETYLPMWKQNCWGSIIHVVQKLTHIISTKLKIAQFNNKLLCLNGYRLTWLLSMAMRGFVGFCIGHCESHASWSEKFQDQRKLSITPVALRFQSKLYKDSFKNKGVRVPNLKNNKQSQI